jgi:hypothetical protein
MNIEDLKSVDELITWLKAHAENPKVTDYLQGLTQGVVDSYCRAGVKKVEFKFAFEETKRNNGQLAGYMLLLSVHADSNPAPRRTFVIYYLVGEDGKIVTYLVQPR